MEQNATYRIFAAIFAKSTPNNLVKNFNREVGNLGFNSQRAAYDVALIDEFIRRGIDVSAVYDGTIIKFAHHVQLDDTDTKLVLTED